MGSVLELNDTLQITRVQGFPQELDYKEHKKKDFVAKDFAGKIFEFRNKSGIRIYHSPPVRNFLVENREGKWIYWGLVEINEITHDYVKKTTSGKFKILYIYTPEEMEKAHDLIDRREEVKFV